MLWVLQTAEETLRPLIFPALVGADVLLVTLQLSGAAACLVGRVGGGGGRLKLCGSRESAQLFFILVIRAHSFA